MDSRIIHASVARSASFSTCSECKGGNSNSENMMDASNDPITLTNAPKRLASSTSTAANRNGAASFHWVLEKTKATAIAHKALTTIPSVDCKVHSHFVFMNLYGKKLISNALRSHESSAEC